MYACLCGLQIASHGKKPYREVADGGLSAHLARGKRLAKPARCGDEVCGILPRLNARDGKRRCQAALLQPSFAH